MTQDISLETGSETVVHVGARTVEFHKEGDITLTMGGTQVELHGDGTIDAYTAGIVRLHAASSDAPNAQPQPGDRMNDGTIFAGVSPDTGKAMYATPADAPLTVRWKAAMQYAAVLDAHGHHDWRVPTKAELDVLWKNQDRGFLRTTFNVTGTGWYWSSTEDGFNYGWDQRFADGTQRWGHKNCDSFLRCVRG